MQIFVKFSDESKVCYYDVIGLKILSKFKIIVYNIRNNKIINISAAFRLTTTPPGNGNNRVPKLLIYVVVLNPDLH
jgi:hypothetical protein